MMTASQRATNAEDLHMVGVGWDAASGAPNRPRVCILTENLHQSVRAQQPEVWPGVATDHGSKFLSESGFDRASNVDEMHDFLSLQDY